MQLVSYGSHEGTRLGVLTDRGVVDVQRAGWDAGVELPSTMRSLIMLGQVGVDLVDKALAAGTSSVVPDARIVVPLPDLTKNVFCVGHNYRAHIEEAARSRGQEPVIPTRPTFFSKATTSVIGPDEAIELDAGLTSELDYEVELIVVIGRRGKNIPAERALDHVFGYTLGNDISARDLQRAHTQFHKGKSLDTYCPLGPAIVPKSHLSADDLRISLRVNGETRQDSRTSDLIFPIPVIIEQLSQGLTLEPGDLIMTGTPAGVALGMTPQRWLAAGDVVEAEIEGIGVLRNPVVAVTGSTDRNG